MKTTTKLTSLIFYEILNIVLGDFLNKQISRLQFQPETRATVFSCKLFES